MIAINVNDIFDKMIGNEDEVIIKSHIFIF